MIRWAGKNAKVVDLFHQVAQFLNRLHIARTLNGEKVQFKLCVGQNCISKHDIKGLVYTSTLSDAMGTH